jgi:hypothetical protein
MVYDWTIEVDAFINIDYILILYIGKHTFNILIHFSTFSIRSFRLITLHLWLVQERRLIIVVYVIVHVLLLPYKI